MMLKLAIFISGRGSNLRAIYRAIEDGRLDAKINLVLSNKSEAPGLFWAKEKKLPTVFLSSSSFKTHQDFALAMLDLLNEYDINFIALAGYIRKVPPEIVSRYYPNIVNIHPALLPQFGGKGFYGSIPHKLALESGGSYTGITVHIVNEEYDKGPIVYQEPLEIKQGETQEELADRSLKLQWKIYPYVLQLFAEGKVKLIGDEVRIGNR